MHELITNAIEAGANYARIVAAVPATTPDIAAARTAAKESKKSFLASLAAAYALVLTSGPDRTSYGLAAIAGILRDARELAERTVDSATVRQTFSRLSGAIETAEGKIVWTWGRGGPRPGRRLPLPAVSLEPLTDQCETIEKTLPLDPQERVDLLRKLLSRAIEREQLSANTAELWESFRDAKRISLIRPSEEAAA